MPFTPMILPRTLSTGHAWLSKRVGRSKNRQRYWRAALVVFFNYGVDTGTVWKSAPFHEPILWRHVTWDPQSTDREFKERSKWGWLLRAARTRTLAVFLRLEFSPASHRAS
jgi:hypothetical protein